MAYADDLDPESSVLAFYATDLRREREAAELSQRDLAKLASVSPSLLNKIEAAKRLPTKEFSAICDERFGTGDHFQRLWKLVIKYAYPTWFRPYVELERSASAIRSFEVQLIPGLLQTPDYARAVLTASRLDRDTVEERLAARLERQSLLAREPAPELWFVLDENVLHRNIGGLEVMRAQLERLLVAAETPSTVALVVPYSAGGYSGVGGPFSVLTLDEGPDVVSVAGFYQGQLLATPDAVKAALRSYDLLTAVALSPQASMDLIAATAKELST